MGDMFKVFSARDSMHASLVRGMLSQHGIEVVEPQSIDLLEGLMLAPHKTAPDIYVRNERDMEQAIALIRKHETPVHPERCPQCQYDLRTLSEPRCPECGHAVRLVEIWTCADCNEKHERQFTVCWNCGGSRDIEPAAGN